MSTTRNINEIKKFTYKDTIIISNVKINQDLSHTDPAVYLPAYHC